MNHVPTNRIHTTPKFVEEEAQSSDSGNNEIKEIKTVQKELASTLREEATDVMKYTDDAASRKYNLQREEQISEELREAEKEGTGMCEIKKNIT